MLLFFIILSFISGKISEEGIQFLIEREGFEPNQYNNIANIKAIGYGFTKASEIALGKKFENIENLSKEYSLDVLKYLLFFKYEKLVDKYDILYNFNQNQYDALVSFAFNVGSIDELTNYGKRTIEEISTSFLNYIYDNKGNPVLKTRRNKEKELFDKPFNIEISSQLNIKRYEPCGGSYIFSAILTSEDYSRDENNITNFIPPKDIGVIYYDPQNGNIMRTKCDSFYKGEILCEPYYPIEKGEYIVKLINPGYFDNGLEVLPFDLTDEMFPKEKQYNEYTKQYEEVDNRIKISEIFYQLPIFKSYSIHSGLFGNFFFHRSQISLYNKKETIKDKYPVEVELSYCFLNYSCEIENKYQIECNIVKKSEELFYNEEGGEYLLKCKGIINTNVYDIENFGNHIEIRYQIGESSHQKIENGLMLNCNFKKQIPRDILEIESFSYEYNETEGNIFYFSGKSLNKKEIRNIGSISNLSDFHIMFSGGIFIGTISSKCFLYNNLTNFLIKCNLEDINGENLILSQAKMQYEFINENNNEYDLILPFEFTFKIEVQRFSHNIYKNQEIIEKNNKGQISKIKFSFIFFIIYSLFII